MRSWVPFALMFFLGCFFGYLVSETTDSNSRIEALTERLAQLEAAPAAPAPLPQRAVAPTQRRVTDVSINGAPVRGNEAAPITIVAFSDFQCPYCSRVHPTLQRLLETYPDRVRLVFKHNPLPMHPNAPLAHKASIAAAEQGHFWEMHDLIFANMRDISRDKLLSYARQLDFELGKFVEDMDSDHVAALLDRDIAESSRLGVTGTPTFLINGKFLAGAQPFENFQVLIERELAQVDRI